MNEITKALYQKVSDNTDMKRIISLEYYEVFPFFRRIGSCNTYLLTESTTIRYLSEKSLRLSLNYCPLCRRLS